MLGIGPVPNILKSFDDYLGALFQVWGCLDFFQRPALKKIEALHTWTKAQVVIKRPQYVRNRARFLTYLMTSYWKCVYMFKNLNR